MLTGAVRGYGLDGHGGVVGGGGWMVMVWGGGWMVMDSLS